MAASSLAAQLQVVAATGPQEERLKGKASLLYEIKEAADIDLATIYAVGVQGFSELCRMDGRFEAYSRTLFSRSASEVNRELQDKEANQKLDVSLNGYLRLLSGFFTTPAAFKSLEYLIRRYKIHVYNVNAAVTCALPYHSTPEFVKLVQLCNLEGTQFYFLKHVKEKGAAPPRDQLVVRCTHDGAFLSFVCQAAAAAASTKGVPGAASAFYAVLLTEALAAMPRVTAQVVPRLLPYLEAGLAPGASAEQYAGALIVATQLASRAPLAPPLTEALLEGVAKGARAPLHAQSLQASLALCQTQLVKDLPARAFKHLVKLQDLPSHLADLCRGYRADALTVPLVRALAASATHHANYERVLAGVIREAPLSTTAVRRLVGELVALGSGGSSSDEHRARAADQPSADHGGSGPGDARATAARLLRLVDAHHPIASSAAVDALLTNQTNQGTDGEKKEKTTSSGDGTGDAAKVNAFLRDALSGSAAGPMPGHAASLAAALDHPTPGLRVAALRELRKMEKGGKGKSGSLFSGEKSAFAGALLRRVTDDEPRVAALAAALPGLRAAVGDDTALFSAAAERLAAAAGRSIGRTPEAESERSVAKACAFLACGVLAGDVAKRRDEATRGNDESDDDDDSDDDSVGAEDVDVAGALAGRAASLALGHVLFSPATRTVARAVLAAVAKHNAHPALGALRGAAFREAFARAQELGAQVPTPEPPKRGKGRGGKKVEMQAAEEDDPAKRKEARSRADAATNRVVIGALGDGLAAWADTGSLDLWARDTWRDGTPRARAVLLLAMRAAAPRSHAVRLALWALLRATWHDECGAGLNDNDTWRDDETPAAGADPATSAVFQAMARDGRHCTAVLPALARAALHATLSSLDESDASDAETILPGAFALMAASRPSASSDVFASHVEALLEAVARRGRSATTFLASIAAANPDAGGSAEACRWALELLAGRNTERNVPMLAALVVAAASSAPAVRTAAGATIAALAEKTPPKGKGKSTGALQTVWSALATHMHGSVTSKPGAKARDALCDALAEGVRSAADSDAALTSLLAPTAAIGSADPSDQSVLGAYGARRLVAALTGVGDDAAKAVALAPALRWALTAGGESASESTESAGLAVEILECYTATYAASDDRRTKKEDASWSAFVSALAPPSPVPSRAAAMSKATPSFVDALPEARRAEVLGALFAAHAGDPDATCRHAARAAAAAMTLRAEDVAGVLRDATEALVSAASRAEGEGPIGGNDDDGASRRGRKKRAVQETTTTEERRSTEEKSAAEAMAAAVAALEVVGWKSATGVTSRGDLVAPCQGFLAALLDAAAAENRTENGGDGAEDSERGGGSGGAAAAGGYAQALVLATLESLARAEKINAKAPEGEKTKTPAKTPRGKKKAADVARKETSVWSRWDVPLVVRAVRETQPGAGKEAALSLLAAVAASDAEGVMDHVLEVSAALAHGSVEAADDPLAQRALEAALAAVVPVWIAGGLGVRAAVSKVVDALPSVPTHRRAPLCAALIRACPPGEGLPCVLLLLLGRMRLLEEEAAAAAGRRARRAAKAAKEAGGAVAAAMAAAAEEERVAADAAASIAWVTQLCALLLAHETATGAADALVATMKGAASEGGRQAWLSAEVTAKHLSSRAFLVAARREAMAAASASASEAEAEAEAARVGARLQEGYASLAERALVLVQASAASEKGASKPPTEMTTIRFDPEEPKSGARMERGGRKVLAALDSLLAPGPYLRALAPLLAAADGRVRRKALRLIAHRLNVAGSNAAAGPNGKVNRRPGEKSRDARSRERAKDHRSSMLRNEKKEKRGDAIEEEEEERDEEWEEEVAAGVALVDMLAGLAGHGGGSSRLAALAAIEAAARRFAGAAAVVTPLVNAMRAVVAALEPTAPRNVAAAGAAALAAVIDALGARALPALPAAVPALFATAAAAAAALDEKTDADVESQTEDEGRVLVASLGAVDVLTERLAGFISPYLPDALGLLLSPALVPPVDDAAEAKHSHPPGSSAAVAATSAAALREALPRAIPVRLMLRPLSEAYDAALARGGTKGAASAAAALRLTAATVSAGPPQEAHRDALVATLLRAMDVRRVGIPGGCPPAATDAVEAAAVDAFVVLSLQLTEGSFVPMFSRVVEWAKARAGEAGAGRARLAALFRLASALSDALRAVFVPLAVPLFDLAAAALDPAADPEEGPARKKRKGSGGKGSADEDLDGYLARVAAWRMRASALGALRRLFTHDAGDVLDAARFNQLQPLVTRQLTASPPRPPSTAAGRETVGEGLAEAAEGAHLVEGGLGFEAVHCVAALVAAAPDDALWKPAHRSVLIATRDGSPRARLVAIAALGAVVDKLREEYLALLPEAIPFLSELFEDPDEAVEGAARSLTARLTEMSGEDLKSLMAEGGGA